MQQWNSILVARGLPYEAIAPVHETDKNGQLKNKKSIGQRLVVAQTRKFGVNEAILQYLTERHASIQWRDFIVTIGSELHASLGADATHQLISRAGARFACETELGHCETLADLERAIAQTWLDMDWGWAQVDDAGDALTIAHACAPVGGMSQEAAGLVCAFLLGAYQQWTSQLGSNGQLQVSQTTAMDETGSVAFRVGLPAGH